MRNKILVFLMGVFLTLSSKNVLGQGDIRTSFEFKPDWKDGMEMVWLHKTTNLSTNERDMPLYVSVDTLYTVMNFSFSDSNTWIVNVTHFERYDEISKTAYIQSKESLTNAPLTLEFDNSFNYLGMKNWEQWRDTLYNNLRFEFEKKLISLKTYSEYRKMYESQEEVENAVVNYYLTMFSIFGRSINLWTKYPMITELKNPFLRDEYLTKSGEEMFFITEREPNEVIRSFVAKSDKEDYQSLSEDYLNYMQKYSETEINIPPPRIIFSRDEVHSYNRIKNQLSSFRLENGVNINGASTLLEYYLILLNIREEK